MADIIVENIIGHAKVADELDIHRIAEKVPGFMYDPTEFLGLTLKLERPNVAILLLPDGKVICTGAKKVEDIEYALKEVANRIKSIGIKIKSKTDIEIQNIVVSLDLGKELNLDSLSKTLTQEGTSYEPNQFPGLIYKIDEIGAVILIFSTGKIVCIGVKNMDNATKALETMKDKIFSIESQ